MRAPLFEMLGAQLREARSRRRLTQEMVAKRVGRDPGRISELERDLLDGRLGKDRLTLLVQICDALDLTPLLVPTSQVAALKASFSPAPAVVSASPLRSTFDEVFVDLSEDDAG